MPVHAENLTFYHCPRTGGTWFMRALDALAIDWEIPYRGSWSTHLWPRPADLERVAVSLTFDRPRDDWLRSCWRFIAAGNLGRLPLPAGELHDRWHDDLPAFVDDEGNRQLADEVFEMYRRHAQHVLPIGSVDGVLDVLRLAGHVLPADARARVAAIGKVNASPEPRSDP